MTSHLLRSALYVPAANARALEKAPSLGADVIIHDLEDSVAPSVKTDSRAALRHAATGQALRVVRINARGTPWHDDDVAAAMTLRPFAILLPKVSGPDDISTLRETMDRDRQMPSPAIWAMIETPASVLNAGAIAAALGPDGALVLGLNDLSLESGIAQSEGRAPMQAILTMTVLAARSHGVAIVDGVFNTVSDIEGFSRECHQARAYGFDGKTVIHPTQISIANATFAPTPSELAAAEAIVSAFDRPENKAVGVLALNGRMVERLHLTMAHTLLEKAAAIATRS